MPSRPDVRCGPSRPPLFRCRLCSGGQDGQRHFVTVVRTASCVGAPVGAWLMPAGPVVAMQKMLQRDELEDYVIATGITRSLGEFVAEVFLPLGHDWRRHVVRDPRLVRASENHCSRTDVSRAASRLGWKARHTMPDVAPMMVEARLARSSPAPRLQPPCHRCLAMLVALRQRLHPPTPAFVRCPAGRRVVGRCARFAGHRTRTCCPPSSCPCCRR